DGVGGEAGPGPGSQPVPGPEAVEDDVGIEARGRYEPEHALAAEVGADDARFVSALHEPVDRGDQGGELGPVEAAVESIDEGAVARVRLGRGAEEADEGSLDVRLVCSRLGDCCQRLEPPPDGREQQRLLVREAPEDGAVADARTAGGLRRAAGGAA